MEVKIICNLNHKNVVFKLALASFKFDLMKKSEVRGDLKDLLSQPPSIVTGTLDISYSDYYVIWFMLYHDAPIKVDGRITSHQSQTNFPASPTI